MVLALLLLGAACSPAFADPPAFGPTLPPAHIALAVAPPKIRAPYDVQILRGNGEALPTYAFRGRFYVQGSANERYLIRIANPTPRRIEAVVSVDGLDVIDGENGDLRKRGYVIPPYGETRIEGFRTSQVDVATFRFSSVAGSYAGQKGKARNVGVIAVALFEEQAVEPEQQIIVGRAPRPVHPKRYDDRDDLDGRARPAARADVPAATADRGAGRAEAKIDRPRDHRPSASPHAATKAADAPAARPAPAPAEDGYAPPSDGGADDEVAVSEPLPEPRRERLGLGTEFGEQRHSAASYTRFVRASGRPVAIAELRYNDAAGLITLGIPVQPLPDPHEILLRETADPFPGDHFAQPPR